MNSLQINTNTTSVRTSTIRSNRNNSNGHSKKSRKPSRIERQIQREQIKENVKRVLLQQHYQQQEHEHEHEQVQLQVQHQQQHQTGDEGFDIQSSYRPQNQPQQQHNQQHVHERNLQSPKQQIQRQYQQQQQQQLDRTTLINNSLQYNVSQRRYFSPINHPNTTGGNKHMYTNRTSSNIAANSPRNIVDNTTHALLVTKAMSSSSSSSSASYESDSSVFEMLDPSVGSVLQLQSSHSVITWNHSNSSKSKSKSNANTNVISNIDNIGSTNKNNKHALILQSNAVSVSNIQQAELNPSSSSISSSSTSSSSSSSTSPSTSSIATKSSSSSESSINMKNKLQQLHKRQSIPTSFTSPKSNVQSSFTSRKQNVQSSFTSPKKNVHSSFTSPTKSVQSSFISPKTAIQSSFTSSQQNVPPYFTSPKNKIQSSFSSVVEHWRLRIASPTSSSFNPTQTKTITNRHTDPFGLIDEKQNKSQHHKNQQRQVQQETDDSLLVKSPLSSVLQAQQNDDATTSTKLTKQYSKATMAIAAVAAKAVTTSFASHAEVPATSTKAAKATKTKSSVSSPSHLSVINPTNSRTVCTNTDAIPKKNANSVKHLRTVARNEQTINIKNDDTPRSKEPVATTTSIHTAQFSMSSTPHNDDNDKVSSTDESPALSNLVLPQQTQMTLFSAAISSTAQMHELSQRTIEVKYRNENRTNQRYSTYTTGSKGKQDTLVLSNASSNQSSNFVKTCDVAQRRDNHQNDTTSDDGTSNQIQNDDEHYHSLLNVNCNTPQQQQRQKSQQSESRRSSTSTSTSATSSRSSLVPAERSSKKSDMDNNNHIRSEVTGANITSTSRKRDICNKSKSVSKVFKNMDTNANTTNTYRNMFNSPHRTGNTANQSTSRNLKVTTSSKVGFATDTTGSYSTNIHSGTDDSIGDSTLTDEMHSISGSCSSICKADGSSKNDSRNELSVSNIKQQIEPPGITIESGISSTPSATNTSNRKRLKKHKYLKVVTSTTESLSSLSADCGGSSSITFRHELDDENSRCNIATPIKTPLVVSQKRTMIHNNNNKYHSSGATMETVLTPSPTPPQSITNRQQRTFVLSMTPKSNFLVSKQQQEQHQQQQNQHQQHQLLFPQAGERNKETIDSTLYPGTTHTKTWPKSHAFSPVADTRAATGSNRCGKTKPFTEPDTTPTTKFSDVIGNSSSGISINDSTPYHKMKLKDTGTKPRSKSAGRFDEFNKLASKRRLSEDHQQQPIGHTLTKVSTSPVVTRAPASGELKSQLRLPLSPIHNAINCNNNYESNTTTMHSSVKNASSLAKEQLRRKNDQDDLPNTMNDNHRNEDNGSDRQQYQQNHNFITDMHHILLKELWSNDSTVVEGNLGKLWSVFTYNTETCKISTFTDDNDDKEEEEASQQYGNNETEDENVNESENNHYGQHMKQNKNKNDDYYCCYSKSNSISNNHSENDEKCISRTRGARLKEKRNCERNQRDERNYSDDRDEKNVEDTCNYSDNDDCLDNEEEDDNDVGINKYTGHDNNAHNNDRYSGQKTRSKKKRTGNQHTAKHGNLCHQTNDSSGNHIQKMIEVFYSLGGYSILIGVLHRWIKNSRIQAECLTAIVALCNSSCSCSCSTSCIGTCSAVQQYNSNTNHDRRTDTGTCSIDDDSYDGDSNNNTSTMMMIHEGLVEHLIYAGIFECMVNAMQLYPNDFDVQLSACNVMKQLTSSSCSNCSSSSITTSNSNRIDAFMKSTIVVQQQDYNQQCQAMSSSSTSKDNNSTIVVAGGPYVIIGAMKQFPHEIDLQNSACCVLYNIASCTNAIATSVSSSKRATENTSTSTTDCIINMNNSYKQQLIHSGAIGVLAIVHERLSSHSMIVRDISRKTIVQLLLTS